MIHEVHEGTQGKTSCNFVFFVDQCYPRFSMRRAGSKWLRAERAYSIGSNFSPYTSSPYCLRIGSQLGITLIPTFNWSTESTLI